MTELCLLDMKGKQSLKLKAGKNWVGRDPDCEIHIDHRLLSRRHAVIGLARNQVAIRDLNSTNGTMVNFKRIHAAHPLVIGDAVTFGELTYRLAVVGIPLRETLLGRSPYNSSYSVRDEGGDGTALREDWPLPHSWGTQTHQVLATPLPSEDNRVKAIVTDALANLSRDALALLVFPNSTGGRTQGYLPLYGKGPWVIGRDDRCDLVVYEETVSLRHARIVKDKDGWVIEDLGSKNGLQVNGVVFRKTRLGPNCALRLGLVHSVFVSMTKSATPA